MASENKNTTIEYFGRYTENWRKIEKEEKKKKTTIGKIKEALHIKDKEKLGGAREKGSHGGFYEYIGPEVEGGTKVGLRAMIKKDDDITQNISEFLGSKLFAQIEPGSGAKVSFIAHNDQDEDHHDIPFKKGDGSNVYVKSEFHPNSVTNPGSVSDMYKHMNNHMSKADRPSSFMRNSDGRPYFMGTRERLKATYTKAFKKLGYQGFEKVMPLSLLMKDDDVHPGNLMVIEGEGGRRDLFRIDFGCSFNNLTNDIDPNTYSNFVPGKGPTNHFREFPTYLKITPEFVEGLNRAANADMGKFVEEGFAEMQKFYNDKAIAKWAKHAMPGLCKNKKISDIDIKDVKDNLKKIMKNRQSSLKEYSLEIELGLLAGKYQKAEYSQEVRADLKELIRKNPEHFFEINNGDKEIRFRDPKLGINAKKFIKNEVKAILCELLKEKQIADNIPIRAKDAAATVATAPPKIMMGIPVAFPAAGISSATATKSNVNKPKPVTSITPQDRQALITQAVRKHVLIPQQLYLRQIIADTLPKEEREKFANQDLDSFNKYIKHEGKEKLATVMKNPETMSSLLIHMEEEGYKELKSVFEKSFKNIDWSIPPSSSKTRTCEIKDAEGKEIVASLIETTISASTPLILAKGESINITHYRQIDFPLKIGQGTEAHFSIALKDENGKNMPKDEALYFTADYDEKGDLSEVSSPIPIKFADNSNDAIGYIEKEGKIYTLPVTQGKYKEMMLKLGRENNLSIVVQDKKIELAEDMMMAKLAPEIKKIVKKTHADRKVLRETPPSHIPPPSPPRRMHRAGSKDGDYNSH